MGQARKNAAAECAQGSLLKACALPSIGFLCAAVGILLGGLMIPAVAGAQSLDYVDFGQPPGEIGFFDTNVSGINSSGDITGYFLDNARDYHSFVVAGGAFHSIGFPGTISTTVLAINDSEQMAGYFYGADNRYHGFLLSGIGGTYTPIDAPGAVHGTYATAMNNLGQVVGYYEDASFQYHGFLFSEGTITTFSPGAPGFFSGTVAINNAGQILGTFNDAPPTRQRAGRHRWLAGGRPRHLGTAKGRRGLEAARGARIPCCMPVPIRQGTQPHATRPSAFRTTQESSDGVTLPRSTWKGCAIVDLAASVP